MSSASALREREAVSQNVTIVLIRCVTGTVTRKGAGSKNKKFYGRHLWMVHNSVIECFAEPELLCPPCKALIKATTLDKKSVAN